MKGWVIFERWNWRGNGIYLTVHICCICLTMGWKCMFLGMIFHAIRSGVKGWLSRISDEVLDAILGWEIEEEW